MPGPMTPAEETIDASSFRIAIVAARFNHDITERLLDGAVRCLRDHGADPDDPPVVWVPGSFELPLACRTIAVRPPDETFDAIAAGLSGGRARSFDAIVALGCVIRGETPHFDYVAGACARGLMTVMLETGVPIAFGVLTTENRAQAEARAGGAVGNKGWEATRTAIEMAALLSGKAAGTR